MGLHGSLEITTCFGDCRGETNAESPLWPAKLFTVADAVAGSPERNGSPIGRGRDAGWKELLPVSQRRKEEIPIPVIPLGASFNCRWVAHGGPGPSDARHWSRQTISLPRCFEGLREDCSSILSADGPKRPVRVRCADITTRQMYST